MATTRTSSPYFSPNSARAPDAMASSTAISRVVTGAFCSTMSLAMSSTRSISSALIGLGWEKSNRSRSGATSEPFWATWSPSTWRSASCSRWVAEWLARIAVRRRPIDVERERKPGLERAFLDHAGMDEQVAGLLLGVGDAEAHAVGRHDAGIADLAAGFAVERRLVEHDGAGLALGQSGDLLAVAHQRGDDAFRGLGLVAQELGGADLLAQREPHGFGRGLAGAGPRRPRHLALALHRRVEGAEIDARCRAA